MSTVDRVHIEVVSSEANHIFTFIDVLNIFGLRQNILNLMFLSIFGLSLDFHKNSFLVFT